MKILVLLLLFPIALFSQKREAIIDYGYPYALNEVTGIAYVGYGLSLTSRKDSVLRQKDFAEVFVVPRVSTFLDNKT